MRRSFVVLFVAACAFAGCARSPDTAPAKKDVPPLPQSETTLGTDDVKLTLTTFDGVENRIAAARGKVVLIDCWATWCGPCVQSFPKLVEKHEKYAAGGLAVISLSTDDPDDAKDVLDFLKARKATFTNLNVPPEEPTFRGMKQRFAYQGGIPHAVVFDRAGQRVWAGHPLDRKMTATIEAELAKPAP
jgi:thiol-disulfide isomerase/thioredoxin